MSVMVTGGGGFIGSHLVRKLVKDGESVVVFDSSPNTLLIDDVLESVEFVRGDVSDLRDVFDAVKTYGVRDVFHTAAMLIYSCESSPMRALRVNVEGTVNLLEAARMMDLCKFVFTSSVAVFSPGLHGPIGDDAPTYPRSVYGMTKLVSELYGLKYQRSFGVDFRALRFTWVYGPGRSRGASAFSSLIVENPAIGEPVKIPHKGETSGDWLYVKDAVRALILARDVENPGRRIFNISGEVHPINHIANIVRKHVPDASIEFDPEARVRGSSYDDSNARQELGWHPSYDIEEGIRDHIEEVRRRGPIGDAY